MCSMLGRYAEIGLMWATQTQIVERLSRCGGLVVFGWNPTRTLLALLPPDSGNGGARERPNLFPFSSSVLYLLFSLSFLIIKFLGTVKQESVQTFVETFTVADQREQLWISCEPAAAATLAAQWISISQDLTFWRTATAIQWVLNLYCISFDEFLISTVFYSMSFESVLYLYFYFFDLLAHTHTPTLLKEVLIAE